MSRAPLVALSTLIVAAAWTAAGAVSTAPGGFELTYLANEGFLVRSGADAVLIDAFVQEPYSGYAALPADVHGRMVAGDRPFAGITLALASHPHRDHFQPASAAAFLRRHRETLLVSSPQVVALVRKELGSDAATAPLKEVLPEPGVTVVEQRGGVRVEFLRLSHGSPHEALHNLGHIVHIGGRTVLHLGDADTDAANFAPYRLAERGLDVALIPYWYLLSHQGRQFVKDHLRARHRVAVHVETEEVAGLPARLGPEFKDVVVFARPLESRRF